MIGPRSVCHSLQGANLGVRRPHKAARPQTTPGQPPEQHTAPTVLGGLRTWGRGSTDQQAAGVWCVDRGG
jgi:hypothetical protein